MEPLILNRDQLAAMLKAEIARHSKVIKAANIQPAM